MAVAVGSTVDHGVSLILSGIEMNSGYGLFLLKL